MSVVKKLAAFPLMTITAPGGSMTLLTNTVIYTEYENAEFADGKREMSAEEVVDLQVQAVHCFMEQHRERNIGGAR